jgi:hypothetical protein
MTSDEWQVHVTREAAKEIGAWLEGRGRLQHPIRCLTMPDLEAVMSKTCLRHGAANAISRFVVLASERIREQPEAHPDLTQLLLG